MRTRTIVSIWFVILLLMGTILFGACGATSSSGSEATKAAPDPANGEAPAIDAAVLLSARCVDCHSLSRVTDARYTQEQWQQVVTNMIRRGAALNSDEEAALVAYLAETYQP